MTTHARVVCIALPIVLSNATSPLLGAVDTAVIGQLGLAAPTGAVVPRACCGHFDSGFP